MNIQHFSRNLMIALALLTGGGYAAAAGTDVHSPAEASPMERVLSVNVNTANAEEIADLLNGVGLHRARAIVAHREAHGPFQSAQDLVAVKGIGQATLERNLEAIRTR